MSALVLAALSGTASAAACTSVQTGFWDVATTWGPAGTGCAGAPGGIPGFNDTVTIANLAAAHTVTVRDNRQVGQLTFAAGNRSATLAIQNGVQLDVNVGGAGNGDVTIGAPSASPVTKLIQLEANSTLLVGRDLNINGGSAVGTRLSEVNVADSSTLTVGRDVVQDNARARLIFSGTGAGTMNLVRHMQDTGTFTCPACTVNLTGGANQNLAGAASGYAYFNIVDQKTGGTGRFTENVTINGSITDNGRLDLLNNNPVITLSGASVQTLGGAAVTTTFESLTVNQAAGGSVSLGHGITIATTLTLTTGIIAGNGNQVIVAAGAAIGGGSAASYVNGCLRKNFNGGDSLNFRAAGLDEFPVGIAGSYLPVEITAGTTSTAGNLVVCVVGTDHPQMTQANGGGIDTTKSVNRYWSMTNTTLNIGAALMNAIFKFPGGATEYDAGATPANFIIQRWDGVDWNPTTLVTAAATSTRAQNINLTAGTNDFQIGEPLAGFPAALGNFNAFDTTTPVGAVLGNIQTKQAGVAFSVRVVRIANNAVNTAYNQAGVTVQLYNASTNTGAFTNGCRSTWSAIGGGTPPSVTVNFAAGVATATFTAAMLPNVWRDVRVRVIKAGGGAGEGCSSDRFAIRPTGFTIAATDGTWSTPGTTRALTNTTLFACGVTPGPGDAHKAGQPFTITAAASPAGATQYDGAITVGTAAGSLQCRTDYGLAACATGALSLGAWTNGVSRVNSIVTYNEAGSFNLLLEDIDFASVDANDGTSLANRTVPQTGGAIAVGRFVPDHFKFTAPNTPQLQTFGSACAAARSFTYIGQRFWYATLPSATVQAVAADDSTITTNYRGPLFKLTSAGFSEAYSENGAGRPALNTANVPPAQAAQLTAIGNGTATYTSRDGAASPAPALAYSRPVTSPIAAANNPFSANISASVTAAEAANCEVGGTIDTSSALVFDGGGGGIAFDGGAFTPVTPNIAGGAAFVYGRMRMLNAAGPTTVDVPVTLQAEYLVSSTTGFAANTADNCTSFVPGNFKLSDQQPSLTTTNMPDSNVSISGPLVSGIANLRLLKPSPAVTTPGRVKICLDLDSATITNDDTCAAAAKADRIYLQGPWSGSPSYDKDPTAQVNLGFFGSQPRNFIFQRENF